MLHREVNGCHLELLPLKVKNCIRNCIRESFLHCVSQNFKCSFSCFTFFYIFLSIQMNLRMLFCCFFAFPLNTEQIASALFHVLTRRNSNEYWCSCLKKIFVLLSVKSETRWNCQCAFSCFNFCAFAMGYCRLLWSIMQNIFVLFLFSNNNEK